MLVTPGSQRVEATELQCVLSIVIIKYIIKIPLFTFIDFL